MFCFFVAGPGKFTHTFTPSLTTKHRNKTNITYRTIWLLSQVAEEVGVDVWDGIMHHCFQVLRLSFLAHRV